MIRMMLAFALVLSFAASAQAQWGYPGGGFPLHGSPGYKYAWGEVDPSHLYRGLPTHGSYNYKAVWGEVDPSHVWGGYGGYGGYGGGFPGYYAAPAIVPGMGYGGGAYGGAVYGGGFYGGGVPGYYASPGISFGFFFRR